MGTHGGSPVNKASLEACSRESRHFSDERFKGYAIYSSGFFTALNDGITSAIISFLRTLVFQVAAVVLLPMLWGIDGVWISIVVAEIMAVVFSVIFLVAKRERYHY